MRILVLRNEPPWPLCYGGRLHAYELCRRLAERHDLLLVAERPCDVADLPFNFECRVARDSRLYSSAKTAHQHPLRLSRAEQFFGVDPVFTADVLRLIREHRPDVVIGMSFKALASLSRIEATPTICDLADDEVLHRWRELNSGRATGKWADLKCLLAATLFERQHIPRVSAVTVLSHTDARWCRRVTGHPRVECIPHGVNCERYQPLTGPEDPNRIVFWGGLTFGPNTSAVLFFAEKVWPLIRRRRPEVKWSIVGWGSPPQLERLRGLPGIEFTGYVEDIRPHVGHAAVAVVPMVGGAGIKNKIMEAWAMARPVLCTPRALGDLPGVHGQNVWLARSPENMADGLLRLLADTQLRRRIGAAGRHTAERHCSWDRAASRLEGLCMELAAARAGTTTLPSGLEEGLAHAIS